MRRKFFLSKFIMFLSLSLIPVCIFGVLSVFYINRQVKEDALEKSVSVTDVMELTIEELTSTLEIFKTTVNSDARFHLAVLSMLGNDSPENVDPSHFSQTMQSLYYFQTAKPYISSLFLTTQDSPYFINGLTRESFSDAADSTWKADASHNLAGIFFKVRQVKRNKFDSHLMTAVTVYQRMKYQELMAVNLNQNYFNTWLDSITNYEGQILLVTDKEGQILFSNRNRDLLPRTLLTPEGYLCTPELAPAGLKKEYFFHAGAFPGMYEFQYLSLIPQREVFHISNTLLKLTFAAGLLTILGSSFLAYVYTRRDCRQIFQIIDLFDKAEKGEFSSPQPPARTNETYFRIINNIISLFMSQTYLKVQLDAKKYALSTAQLSALQYQLNPHFLFNTLQSIDLEVMKVTKRPVTANIMISELSALLRYSLHAPMTLVTVREEADATQSYIRLQALRLAEPFQVIWDREPEVEKLKIPRLLLQPLIENSISHCVPSRMDRLKIKIRINVRKGFLTIAVIDNGPGIPSQNLALLRQNLCNDQVEETGRHIGLKNISQRIRLSYEHGYVKLWGREGMGTVVTIGGIGVSS